MKYQLVLQLSASTIEDYDVLVDLENELIRRLGTIGCVDGHDAGSGEMNIFILTDEPLQTFNLMREFSCVHRLLDDLKVAYREIGGDSFTILHPAGLKHFAVA